MCQSRQDLRMKYLIVIKKQKRDIQLMLLISLVASLQV
jgi:hypothetical protein